MPSEVGARYHGDEAAEPGLLDFAVNVRAAAPPPWLVERLATRLVDLGRYPGGIDERSAVAAVAERHGRAAADVAILAGAAEGFALLVNLRPKKVALVAPSFTEPDTVLSGAGIECVHVVLPAPFVLAGARVPEDSDMVIVGNPTNPTAVLHPREQILALRRPGRILVVDEAFADAVPGEPESVAGEALPDVLVLRSLTKTWALAGLRVGYALGSPEVLARLTSLRAHWPIGTLQLEAVAACCAPDAVEQARQGAEKLARLRAEMVAGLRVAGFPVSEGTAPFVLFGVPDPDGVRKKLRDNGIAIRRCDTFVGLPEGYLRAAVRPEWPVLIDALVAATR
ncbi:MAG: threonine-phosphate decarboxylase [Mycobacterium sp.]|nr:threonine-phosphate decarboxylase [Mycobacterium sp.]